VAYNYVKAGQIITASDLNDLGLVGQVVFMATRDAAQTIVGTSAGNPASAGALSWDAVDLDDLGGWSSGSATRYTVQRDGWYEVVGGVSLVATTAVTVVTAAIAVNGAIVAAGHGDREVTAGTSVTFSFSTRTLPLELSVSDYVQVWVGHNDTSAPDTLDTSTGGVRPFVNIKYVRPLD
jgi:hypothetical protein